MRKKSSYNDQSRSRKINHGWIGIKIQVGNMWSLWVALTLRKKMLWSKRPQSHNTKSQTKEVRAEMVYHPQMPSFPTNNGHNWMLSRYHHGHSHKCQSTPSNTHGEHLYESFFVILLGCWPRFWIAGPLLTINLLRWDPLSTINFQPIDPTNHTTIKHNDNDLSWPFLCHQYLTLSSHQP